MELSFALISNISGCISFTLLGVYLLIRGTPRLIDRSLLLASLLTAVWLGVLVIQNFGANISYYLRYAIEIMRTASWFSVIYTLLGIGFLPSPKLGWNKFFTTILVIVLLAVLLGVSLVQGFSDLSLMAGSDLLVIHVSLCIVGLLLVETGLAKYQRL